mmetsp:Transcript_15692/g.22367  ORF Transcript_15692/g.22367 Transcript_15692/m.22367 type:complete len:238 (-) Transcript_15692:894-1607(-)
MLNGDTEVSPSLTTTQGAHEEESPPFSELRPNFPFNPSPITQPSIQESEEGGGEDYQQRMVSSTNAEYSQSQSGVYLSVPLASTTALKLTFDTDYSQGYDSDGELGPFFDAVEGEEDFEDDDSDDDSIFFLGAGFSSPVVDVVDEPEPEAALPGTIDAAEAPPTKETLMQSQWSPKKNDAAPARPFPGENEEENTGFHCCKMEGAGAFQRSCSRTKQTKSLSRANSIQRERTGGKEV